MYKLQFCMQGNFYVRNPVMFFIAFSSLDSEPQTIEQRAKKIQPKDDSSVLVVDVADGYRQVSIIVSAKARRARRQCRHKEFSSECE